MITDKELMDLIDGKLDVKAAEEIRKIIAKDPEVQKRFESLNMVEEALTEPLLYKPSGAFTDNVMNNLHKKIKSVALDYNGFWKKQLFIVACIIVIGLIAGIVLLSDFSLTNIFPTVGPQEITVSERTINIDPGKINFINQDIFIKGIVYLNAVLALFLLERAVFRPFFKARKQQYSY